MHDQLIQDSGQFGDTFIVFIFFLDTGQSTAEVRLSLDIVALLEIKIAQLDLADCLVQAVLGAFLHAQLIVFDGIDCIFTAHIDVAQRIIDLVEQIFVLFVFRHPVQHLDHFLVIAAGKYFGLPDTGGKLQFVWRIGLDHLPEHLVGKPVLILFGINLSQQVLHPGTLAPVLLCLDCRLEVRDRFFILLILHQIVGIYRCVLVQVLTGNTVRIQFPQDIFRFIKPSHFRIATSLPETGFASHFFIMGIMTGYVGEGG